MSSTIPMTTPGSGGTAESSDVSRIPHFDATVRRKEKMRRKAAQQGSPGGKPSGNGHPAAQSPPTPTVSTTLPPDVPASNISASNISNSVQSPSPAVPAQPAVASPRVTGEALEQYLIDFVVEQTGYPAEMVELDADLEADLGIDSIKKAQLFGELAQEFDVKSSDDLSLDDFPTLRHVKTYLEAASGTAAANPVASARAESIQPSAATVPSSPAAEPAAALTPGSTDSETDSDVALSGTALEQYLINFVVEQTGYPTEMVELDADLEADLGIDSIKKAQLFGELANDFEIQTSDDLSLDDYPTLRHVKEFLESAAPRASSPSTTAPAPAPAPAPAVPPANVAAPVEELSQAAAPPSPSALSGAELEAFLVNFVVEQTGYPAEMVELDADLEADLGIDSIKKAQLFGELANDFGIQTSDDLSLDDYPTLRHVKAFLENAQGLKNAQGSPAP